jgi:hypothetical protein
MAQKRINKHYPDQFKEEAVALVSAKSHHQSGTNDGERSSAQHSWLVPIPQMIENR